MADYVYTTDVSHFQIIEVTDPENPMAKGSVALAANDIYKQGKYCYLISDNIFYVVDVLDKDAPFIAATYNDVANLYDGRRVFCLENYAYCCGGTGFFAWMSVIDISNPLNPILVGRIVTSVTARMWDARGIFVKKYDNDRIYAFVIGGNEFTQGKNLTSIDVTDPTNPTYADRMGIHQGNLQGIWINGNICYITNFDTDAVYSFNVSDATNLIFLDAIASGAGVGLDNARGIYADSEYAYVCNNSDGGSVTIINAINPSAMTQEGIISNIGRLNGARDVFVKNNIAYTIANVSDSLQNIDVNDKSTPEFVGSIYNGEQGVHLNGVDSIWMNTFVTNVDFIGVPVEGVMPLTVQFTDLSTSDGEIRLWLWDFGDGNTSTEQNPIHIYERPGTYTVSLTVDN